MFSWMKTKPKPVHSYDDIAEELQHYYQEKLAPLEEQSRYRDLYNESMAEQDFFAKPTILFLGQYSTGKTTFIKYLLEEEYPGSCIGAEPTTDAFVAIYQGKNRQSIPGNALVMDPKMPFTALEQFGNNFLTKFRGSTSDNPILQSLMFIDTPGILAGAKQKNERGYDFIRVTSWFAERADLIIFMFDSNKLDISDEVKEVILSLEAHESKMRIVLNKADMENSESVMKVYGGLMWSLGKISKRAEVMKVYIGSFWNQALRYDYFKQLFEAERNKLFAEIQDLPNNALTRKINDVSCRARSVKVHCHMGASLRAKKKKKKEVLADLDKVFREIAADSGTSVGDFPKLAYILPRLTDYDFANFQPLDE